jgi:hypothetical protein
VINYSKIVRGSIFNAEQKDQLLHMDTGHCGQRVKYEAEPEDQVLSSAEDRLWIYI